MKKVHTKNGGEGCLGKLGNWNSINGTLSRSKTASDKKLTQKKCSLVALMSIAPSKIRLSHLSISSELACSELLPRTEYASGKARERVSLFIQMREGNSEIVYIMEAAIHRV